MDRFEQACPGIVSVVPWLPVLDLFETRLAERAVTHGLSLEANTLMGVRGLRTQWRKVTIKTYQTLPEQLPGHR